MAEMDFNQVLEWLKEEMEKLNEHKTENIPSFNIPEPFLSVIERQRKEIEKQHFEILALEANLKGNDKIIQKQQMEIDSLTLDKGYLLEENKDLKEHRDNLNSIIFDLEKEIAKWKEKEFAACSKHHEFIDDIERLEKALKFYADKENYVEWDNATDLYEYIHNVDFDSGDIARKALEGNLTTGQRLKKHLDEHGKEYYESIKKETKRILKQDINGNKLKSMTVLQLAQMLEDGLLNACWLDENMSVLEFLTEYLN